MICTFDEIKKICESLKGEDINKIVFTNGCFDILHRGHVEYLSKAKSLGDILVLGLNSDDSVRRLKGKSRPINNQKDRAFVMNGLRSVDYVVIFSEDTPLELIKITRPDVIAKGGDYTPDQVVGREIVERDGGRVEIIPFVLGFSSSKTIEKIAK
jgi:rfaE bifunctional protein nucleotidyltransferase chain/domain